MKALIDGDILRYEIGFGAETGWRAITGEENAIPPFDYVQDLLEQRIASILAITQSDEYCLYLTEGKTFRYDLGTTRPYKGTRHENKPWHFDNLTAYIKGVLPVEVIRYIEADDAMAIEHSKGKATILCSRDKDLCQVPGLFYSWELGKQPAFGPTLISRIGELRLVEQAGKKVIKGTGYAFFCSQLFTGDRVDNIPGCIGVGPVMAYEILKDCKEPEKFMNEIEKRYQFVYEDKWEEVLIEQGQLLWIVRRLNPDGTPELWKRGLYV